MDFNTSVAPPSPVALELRPPVSQSPLEIAAQMQANRTQQMQQQALGMENQQRQMDLQDQQTMRSMLPQLLSDPAFHAEDGTPDWNKVSATLAQHVTPKTAFGLQQTILGNQEKAANIQKAHAATNLDQSKIAETEADYLGSVGAAIQKSGYNPAVTDAMLAHAEMIHSSYKPHIDKLREFIGQDPANLKIAVDGMVGSSLAATKEQREQGSADVTNEEKKQQTATAKRALAIQELSGIVDQQGNPTDPAAVAQWQRKYPDIAPPSAKPEDLARFIRSGVPVKEQPGYDVDKVRANLGLMGNTEYDQFLGAYAQKLGKTPATLTPDEKLASFPQFAEMKKDPAMREMALAQANFANMLKQTTLDQMPTKEDAQRLANDIINHRLAPDQLSAIRGRGNGALGLMIDREMAKINPGFNWEEASSEYQLGKSPGFQQTVKYMDYVGQSVDKVISAADKLANGKIRSLNAVKNWSKSQLNDVDLAKFNTDRLEVADAIAKILQGGGSGAGTSDAKLKQAESILQSSDSPSVIRASMNEIKDLIGKRRSTLTKGTFMEGAQPAAEKPAAGGGAHVIQVGAKQYRYNGTGATDDLKNYTEVKQ